VVGITGKARIPLIQLRHFDTLQKEWVFGSRFSVSSMTPATELRLCGALCRRPFAVLRRGAAGSASRDALRGTWGLSRLTERSRCKRARKGSQSGSPSWFSPVPSVRSCPALPLSAFPAGSGSQRWTRRTAYGCRGPTGMCRSSTPRRCRSVFPPSRSSGPSGTACRLRSGICRCRDSARGRCIASDTAPSSSGDVAPRESESESGPVGMQRRCRRFHPHSGRSRCRSTRRRCGPAGCPERTLRR
jgi:hypothetical protein